MFFRKEMPHYSSLVLNVSEAAFGASRTHRRQPLPQQLTLAGIAMVPLQRPALPGLSPSNPSRAGE